MNRNIQTDAAGFSVPQRKVSLEQGNDTPTNYRRDSRGIIPKYPQLNPEDVASAEPAASTSTDISIENIFGKFHERIQFSLDSLEYPRNGQDPGLVLILNQENFVENCNNTRNGSRKDVEDIITCFGRLGFNIRRDDHVFQDLSKESIFRNIDKVLNSDLSQINSVLVFILSHGENCNRIHAREGSFQLEEVLSKFEKCGALKGKPKMFVIQACKGNDKTDFSSGDKKELLVPWSTFEKVYSDVLIIYSTLEGKFSFRDTENGTWLIQEICKNFTAYGRRDDVLTLSSRVIKCICTNYYYSNRGSDVEKQIPVVVSTLSKKFYLNRNKDRNYFLESSRMMDRIIDDLKMISDEMKNSLQLTS